MEKEKENLTPRPLFIFLFLLLEVLVVLFMPFRCAFDEPFWLTLLVEIKTMANDKKS